MNITGTTELTTTQKTGILQLWNNEFPEKLKHEALSDFDNYLKELSGQEHYLLLTETGEIKGWTFTFIREGEKWFALLLDKSIHGLGYGSRLLNRLKEKEEKLSGWVIDQETNQKQNGDYYISPLKFYLRNGFTVYPEIRLENDKMSAVKIGWTR